jgi:periplasmic protein TonB
MSDPAPRGAYSETATLKGVGMAPIDAARAPKISPPAHPPEFYKSRSLASGNWGALTESGQPLRELTPEEARDTVLRGLLDTPLEKDHRNPFEWVVSLAVHLAVITAVVVIPLAFTQALDSTDLHATYLSLPAPPAPPPPPPSAPDLPVRRSFRRVLTPALTMPTVIPKRIAQIKDEDAPDISGGGVVGGVTGGEDGGVLGGVLGGKAGGPAPPPPPPSSPKNSIHRVGGDVKPPRQLVSADPVYPIVAQTARVEGIVEVDAVIDERGNVVQARAVSGPKLLYAAALQTVLKWKYEPTYLDGMPASVQMEVQVVFHLHR